MCIYINIEYWPEYPFKPLAKSILIPLGLTAATTEIEAAFHEKMFRSGFTKLIISSEEMNDIMNKRCK